ncbi:MAG: hypothetical protein ACKPKO_40920, partial [Candidatus Fonsibacter sp.]
LPLMRPFQIPPHLLSTFLPMTPSMSDIRFMIDYINSFKTFIFTLVNLSHWAFAVMVITQ